jgi:hypothetical protein
MAMPRRSGGSRVMSRPAIRRAPATGGNEAGDGAQERGLAAAGSAEKRHEAALGDLERQLVQHGRLPVAAPRGARHRESPCSPCHVIQGPPRRRPPAPCAGFFLRPDCCGSMIARPAKTPQASEEGCGEMISPRPPQKLCGGAWDGRRRKVPLGRGKSSSPLFSYNGSLYIHPEIRISAETAPLCDAWAGNAPLYDAWDSKVRRYMRHHESLWRRIRSFSYEGTHEGTQETTSEPRTNPASDEGNPQRNPGIANEPAYDLSHPRR